MQNHSAPSRPPLQGFFLPDLCSVQAVLLLILVGELLALVLVLAASGMAAFNWQSLALTSLFVQWCVLGSAGLLCRLHPALARWPLPLAALGCLAAVLCVVTGVSFAGQWLTAGRPDWDGWRIDFWLLAEHLVISAILAGIALRYFYLSQQLRLRDQAALQSRIEALQARMRPHFLFNSMNSIASLIGIDPVAAERAVEDLAALFRASLRRGDERVTVADELGLCEAYLRIEQWRLGDRLQIRQQLDPALAGLPIPALSLQPLVENAVYHGIQQIPAGGVLTLSGRIEGGQVIFEVTNPLPVSPQPGRGNREALVNIQLRLQALFGDAAGLDIQRDKDLHTVRLHYPLPAAEAP